MPVIGNWDLRSMHKVYNLRDTVETVSAMCMSHFKLSQSHLTHFIDVTNLRSIRYVTLQKTNCHSMAFGRFGEHIIISTPAR